MTTILLLAGMSARMGKNKLLLPYGNKTVLEYPLKIALRHSNEVICVTGFERERVEKVLSAYDVKIRYNPNFIDGQRGSTLLGLQDVHDDAAILFGDLPLITSDDFEKGCRLVKEFPYCRPIYNGTPGHPVFIAKEKINGLVSDTRPFKEFLKDAGCRFYPGSLGTVFDVDTPERYELLINRENPILH